MEIDAYLTVSEKKFIKDQSERGMFEAPNFYLEYIKNEFDKLNKKYGYKRISKIYSMHILNKIKTL